MRAHICVMVIYMGKTTVMGLDDTENMEVTAKEQKIQQGEKFGYFGSKSIGRLKN